MNTARLRRNWSDFVGQVGNLPADVNRPVAELYRNIQQADLQSAAGYQPAPHRAALIRLLVSCIVLGCSSGAQTPDSSQKIETLERQLAAQRHLLNDWGGLTKFGSENTELRPPALGESRVVFLGDQITWKWGHGDAKFFPDKPYLNRGIAGQTTAQMLVRFRQDVIALQPKVVVILAGTNDIAGAFGLATEEMIADNIMTMTELAKAHGIRVVLASLTPVCDCFGKPSARRRWQEKIIEVNELLMDFAVRSGSVYLDYYAALVDGQDLRKEFTADGLLPNDAGYNAMAPLAERAIAEAIGKK
jgi:lysophospholipase L1-like esterase